MLLQVTRELLEPKIDAATVRADRDHGEGAGCRALRYVAVEVIVGAVARADELVSHEPDRAAGVGARSGEGDELSRGRLSDDHGVLIAIRVRVARIREDDASARLGELRIV